MPNMKFLHIQQLDSVHLYPSPGAKNTVTQLYQWQSLFKNHFVNLPCDF